MIFWFHFHKLWYAHYRLSIVSMGGILVFWEVWQKHIVKCEEMKLCKNLDLNVKVKNHESKFWRINES